VLDAYFEAFEDFLRTGNCDRLTQFTDGGSNPDFLNVYRNGYLKTCTDALAASYPVVGSLVGEDYFRSLARAYVEAHPPTTGTLVGYGSGFAEFLRARSNEHGLDYLADAAAIDAAWLASYFAKDEMALAPTDVESISAAGVDVSTIRVKLTPPTQLVSLHHHIVGTWVLIREQGALTSGVSLREGDNMAMVWRRDGQIHIRALEPGESAFLSTLAGVSTLEEAANSAFQADESFDLATAFAELLKNNVLQLESQHE
jgi:hypothetical protein